MYISTRPTVLKLLVMRLSRPFIRRHTLMVSVLLKPLGRTGEWERLGRCRGGLLLTHISTVRRITVIKSRRGHHSCHCSRTMVSGHLLRRWAPGRRDHWWAWHAGRETKVCWVERIGSSWVSRLNRRQTYGWDLTGAMRRPSRRSAAAWELLLFPLLLLPFLTVRSRWGIFSEARSKPE